MGISIKSLEEKIEILKQDKEHDNTQAIQDLEDRIAKHRAKLQAYYKEKLAPKRRKPRNENGELAVKFEVTKVCAKCGKEFTAHSQSAKYCEECRKQVILEKGKKYRQTEQYKEVHRKYRQTEKYKEMRKKYQQSEKFKKAQEKYYQSEKGKETRKKYANSVKGMITRVKYLQKVIENGGRPLKEKPEQD